MEAAALSQGFFVTKLLTPTENLMRVSRDKRGYRRIVNENLHADLSNDGLRQMKSVKFVSSELIIGLELLVTFAFFAYLTYSGGALLYSLLGCKLQAPHTDFPNKKGSWSMIMSLKNGSKLVIYGSSDELFDIPIVIVLDIGETVFFADNIIHSGGSYLDDDNFRFIILFDKHSMTHSERAINIIHYP
jgi:hypothetical protein